MGIGSCWSFSRPANANSDNLKDDISEKRDLAADHPEKVRDLHDKLTRWRSEVKAPMPSPNSNKSDQPGSGKKRKQN
jgi:hypothetical protein